MTFLNEELFRIQNINEIINGECMQLKSRIKEVVSNANLTKYKPSECEYKPSEMQSSVHESQCLQKELNDYKSVVDAFDHIYNDVEIVDIDDVNNQKFRPYYEENAHNENRMSLRRRYSQFKVERKCSISKI